VVQPDKRLQTEPFCI